MQKSAAVATPVNRPAFTISQLQTSKASSLPQQVPASQAAPMSTDIHIKESGVQLPGSISVVRHQIPLNVPSSMFVTPVRGPAANAPPASEKQRYCMCSCLPFSFCRSTTDPVISLGKNHSFEVCFYPLAA